MKIKLIEIAKEAEVSVAAVSMALNNKKGVSDETRNRIIKIANKMGYVERKSDESKNKQEHKYLKFIALQKHGQVLSDTAFFAQLMEGVENESRINKFELLLSNIKYSRENVNEVVNSIKSENIQGVLILSTELSKEEIKSFINIKKPVVFIDSYFDDVFADCVLMDNFQAVYQAIQHLFNNGHIGIGYLKSSIWIHNFEERNHGYIQAMNKLKIPINEDNIIELRPTLEGSYEDMVEFIKNNGIEKFPTAFFADNDIIALGALRALIENNIKVPDDVSIIGMDDMPFCEFCIPHLTTIRVFKQEIGKTAVNRIMEKIDNPVSKCRKTSIGTEIVNRQSVSCIKE